MSRDGMSGEMEERKRRRGREGLKSGREKKRFSLLFSLSLPLSIFSVPGSVPDSFSDALLPLFRKRLPPATQAIRFSNSNRNRHFST